MCQYKLAGQPYGAVANGSPISRTDGRIAAPLVLVESVVRQPRRVHRDQPHQLVEPSVRPARGHPMTEIGSSASFGRLHRKDGPVGFEQYSLGVTAEQELADPGAAAQPDDDH